MISLTCESFGALADQRSIDHGQVSPAVAAVLAVAADDVEVDLEEGQLAAESDGLDDEDLGPLVEDEVGDGLPPQEAFLVVQGGPVGRRLQFESG